MNVENVVYILDSYAVLAYFTNEPGMERVKEIFEEVEGGECLAYLSMINMGEVIYIVERRLGLSAAHRTLAAIEQLPITLLEVSKERVLDAAHIKAEFSLSYAEAFAVVVAREFGGRIVTADPEFKSVEGIIDIEWLGRAN